jgi:hypothetical protein
MGPEVPQEQFFTIIEVLEAIARETDRSVSQVAPSARSAPVSTQTGAPVAQAMAPAWQGLAGAHADPATHATQLPPLHTRPVPQAVPSAKSAVVATQAGAPVVHERAPAWQAVLGVQADPATHATQAPPLHTSSVPHAAPSARSASVSTHEGDPVLHEIAPARQGVSGVHAPPG